MKTRRRRPLLLNQDIAAMTLSSCLPRTISPRLLLLLLLSPSSLTFRSSCCHRLLSVSVQQRQLFSSSLYSFFVLPMKLLPSPLWTCVSRRRQRHVRCKYISNTLLQRLGFKRNWRVYIFFLFSNFPLLSFFSVVRKMNNRE